MCNQAKSKIEEDLDLIKKLQEENKTLRKSTKIKSAVAFNQRASFGSDYCLIDYDFEIEHFVENYDTKLLF